MSTSEIPATVEIILVPSGALTGEAQRRVALTAAGARVVDKVNGVAGVYQVLSARVERGAVLATAAFVDKPTDVEACEIATKTAGLSDAGWNERFVASLRKSGYRLRAVTADEKSNSLMAPMPFEQGWRYAYPCVIESEIDKVT
jgi:hypothetical protein